MPIMTITAVLVTILLLMVLYRNLPNKKIFFAFCLTLLVSASAVGYAFITQPAVDLTTDESTIRRITAQQQIFDGWYTDYKKQIDQLDYNWAQCQMIITDYHNDNISAATVYTRLKLLEHQAQMTSDNLKKLEPPISLDDANYNLTMTLSQKTQAYATAQLTTITALREAAEPARLTDKGHAEQSRIFREIMLRNGADGLFTSAETAALRANLTLPNN